MIITTVTVRAALRLEVAKSITGVAGVPVAKFAPEDISKPRASCRTTVAINVRLAVIPVPAAETAKFVLQGILWRLRVHVEAA